MSDQTLEGTVKELHKDLVRKYKRHHHTVGRYWRSFGIGQRIKYMKAGARNGEVLKHPMGISMGNVCKFIPEWNLRDITKPRSDALLDLLDHRTSKDLCDQYFSGVNDGPGDRELIGEMMHTRNLRLA